MLLRLVGLILYLQTILALSFAGVIPDQPFNVIWHTKTQNCKRQYGVDVDVTSWGMLQNDIDAWHGKYVTLFSAANVWPEIHGATMLNGGVPQNSNPAAFKKNLTTVLKHSLPANFSGLGVFDIEIWRPLFKLNVDAYSRYQKVSQYLERKKHPTWNDSQIYSQAMQDFDNASPKFWAGAVQLGKKLWPNATFGYYGIPYGLKNYTLTKQKVQRYDLSWLYAASSGLFPSCYLRHPYEPPASNFRRIATLLNETRTVRDANNPDTAIYAYIHNLGFFLYALTDLIVNIGQAADLGLNGVLIWSGTGGRTARQCTDAKHYVDGLLGPYVEYVMNFTKECSNIVCGGHGRCALHSDAYLNATTTKLIKVMDKYFVKMSPREMEKAVSSLTPELLQVYKETHDVTNPKMMSHVTNVYFCYCYRGWSGDTCSVPQKTTKPRQLFKQNHTKP